MKQVALTGATGRLATALIPLLKGSPINWINVSRKPGEGLVSYEELLKRDRESLDAIVHMAWSSMPVSAEKEPSLAWNHDFPLIERLLSAELIRPGGRFIFISSAGTVYGDTHGKVVNEDHPLRPVGQYGSAKVFAEQLVLQLCRYRGFVPVILRLTNPYGLISVSQIPQGVIGFAMHAAANGNTFEAWGDGSTEKDYIHVNDVASALCAVIEDQLAGIFNLSTGLSTSLDHILSLIEKVSGKTIHTRRCPANPWDVSNGTISNRKLQLACSWKPKIQLEDGLLREWKRFPRNLPSNG